MGLLPGLGGANGTFASTIRRQKYGTVTVLAILKLYRWIDRSVAPIVNMWNWGGIRAAPTLPIEHNGVDIDMMEVV